MTAKSMMPYVEGNSAIRAMFEECARMAAQFGKENVYDFSLGNPSVPAPEAVNQAIVDILGTKKEPVHRQTLNVLSMLRLPLPVFTSNQVKDNMLFFMCIFYKDYTNQSSVSSSFFRKDSLQA